MARVPARALAVLTHPVYPTGGMWEDTVEMLTGDEVEGDLIDYLRQVVRDGPFRKPVVLDDEVDEDEAGNEFTTGRILVGNGTHRMAAALLENADVDVEWATPATDGGPFDVVEVAVDLHDDSEATLDRFISAVRSFPDEPDRWVESLGMASLGEAWMVSYPREQVTTERAIELVRARLARYELPATVTGATVVTIG